DQLAVRVALGGARDAALLGEAALVGQRVDALAHAEASALVLLGERLRAASFRGERTHALELANLFLPAHGATAYIMRRLFRRTRNSHEASRRHPRARRQPRGLGTALLLATGRARRRGDSRGSAGRRSRLAHAADGGTAGGAPRRARTARHRDLAAAAR